jgi:hypothetical protein
LAVQVGDAAVRRRIEDIALAIVLRTAIAKMMGHFPSRIGRECRRAGRNALGHVLGGEELEPHTVVDEYREAIEEDQALYEEAMADDKERRSRNEPDSSPGT